LHTRQHASTSPTNFDKQQANKRRKNAYTAALPLIDLTGKGAAQHAESAALSALEPRLDNMLRKATATKSVVLKFATILNKFVASYNGA
jgi:hypothetical protein